MKKKITLYSVISAISYFIRQVFIPNPFENFNWFFSNFFNYIFGLILFPVTFFLVGCIYISGEKPWLGSLAYLIIYCLIPLFLSGFLLIGTKWWLWLLLFVAILAYYGFVIWKLIRNDDSTWWMWFIMILSILVVITLMILGICLL